MEDDDYIVTAWRSPAGQRGVSIYETTTSGARIPDSELVLPGDEAVRLIAQVQAAHDAAQEIPGGAELVEFEVSVSADIPQNEDAGAAQ